MQAAWIPFVGLATLVACDANVVDAVTDPPPVMEPKPEPVPDPKPDPKPEPEPEPEPLSPLATSLIHRYSFDGEGTRVLDSKGAAHGEAVGATLLGDGRLALAGENSGQFVDLPNGIISGLSNATLEIWLTWQGGGVWQRIFDFGSSNAAEGVPGTSGKSYLFLTTEAADDPARSLTRGLRASYSTGGSADEEICHGPEPFPTGVPGHVAVVIDAAQQSMTLYQDGALLVACSLSRPLSLIEDVNNWLGQSNYGADVELSGTYDEFRIYSAALTMDEIAASFAAGPDAKP